VPAFQPPDDLTEETPAAEQPDHTDRQPFYQLAFFSPGSRRLRSGWRLLIQLVLMIILLYGLRFAVGYFLVPRAAWLRDNQFFITQFSMLIAVTFSVFFSRVVLDQRSIGSLGLELSRKTWLQLAFGLAVGGAVMGLIFLMEWAFGWLEFSGFAWRTRPAGSLLLEGGIFLLIFGAVAWQEELLFRGYWLQNLEEGLNLVWAVVITSALFAAAHWGNPQFSVLPLVGLFLAGVLIAFSYLVSGGLWMPIGLHLGWNLFGGLVLGFPVGGLQVPSLVQHELTGPALWTGGSFGPEAGLVLVPALLLGGFLLWAYRAYSALED
jgi:hypothetical protein